MRAHSWGSELNPASGSRATNPVRHGKSPLVAIALGGALWLGGGACKVCADDWPQWRGPQRTGISSEKNWSEAWPADGPVIRWKAKVGLGFASFAVADGRVLTTGNADNTDSVFCLAADTGQVQWKHSYPADVGAQFFEGGTTGTPTVHAGRVYTLSRWGDAFCFEAASGKVIWSKNVAEETGARIPSWGFGGSPVVLDDLLILNVGEAGLALERNTGKIVWQSATKDAGYSTPLPVDREGEWQVLLGNATSYAAVNARTGKEAWRFRWLTQYGVNAADPIVQGDQVFLASGYGKGATLLQLGTGAPAEIWKSRALRTQMNPAVLFAGHLYGVDGDTTEKATLKCLEFATGTEKWSLPDFGSGAVTLADGRLIALSARGELMIAPATPAGFKPTSRAQVLGGKCWTVPVLANGTIYCRNSRGEVVAVDVAKK